MLPRDKKLISVEYAYSDGTKYILDEANAHRHEKNIQSTEFLAATKHWQHLPVTWIVVEPKLKTENK